MFVFNRNLHDYGLRNQLRLAQVNVRSTKYGLNSIKSQCTKAWNCFTDLGIISVNNWPMGNSSLKKQLKLHYFGLPQI